jgi:hypothetical protein
MAASQAQGRLKPQVGSNNKLWALILFLSSTRRNDLRQQKNYSNLRRRAHANRDGLLGQHKSSEKQVRLRLGSINRLSTFWEHANESHTVLPPFVRLEQTKHLEFVEIIGGLPEL